MKSKKVVKKYYTSLTYKYFNVRHSGTVTFKKNAKPTNVNVLREAKQICIAHWEDVCNKLVEFQKSKYTYTEKRREFNEMEDTWYAAYCAFCACCINDDCADCPIKAHTGFKQCRNTPWEDFHDLSMTYEDDITNEEGLQVLIRSAQKVLKFIRRVKING